MKNGSKYTLGVMVTDRLVYAVLLQDSPEGPQPLRHFTRQRTSHIAGGAAGAGAFGGMVGGMPEGMPGEMTGLEAEGSSDFTIQFGEGSGSGAGNLFLSSEFGGSDAAPTMPGEAPAKAPDCTLELSDILAECNDAGYEDPLVAFAVPSGDVSHIELRAVGKKPRRKSARKGDQAGKAEEATPLLGRTQLLALLTEQAQADVDTDRVAFLPMTPSEEGVQRVLALIPKGDEDVVSATLKAMRKQRGRRLPSVRLLDTEASLYLGLARAARRAEAAEGAEQDAQESTLVIRAGTEDTLVMFLKGDALHHYDSLRSLTSRDAPETICSRVLLQQDEYGVGEVQRVLLLSGECERELQSSVEMFFPGVQVISLRRCVPGVSDDALEAPDALSMVPAAGAALRLAGGDQHESAFEEVNLLPKQLTRRRIRLPFTWHSLALSILLFATTLFFVARFFSLQHEIGDARERLRSYPPALEKADVHVLQARIDSLQQAYAGYMNALNVMDSLLVGSDRWSRALEKTAQAAAAVEGIWIDQWQPTGSGLKVAGYATARDRVVRFADHTRGSIEKLNFAEIRDWPVYSFSIAIPIHDRLPEAATYLRERVKLTEHGDATSGARAGSNQGTAVPVTPAKLEDR